MRKLTARKATIATGMVACLLAAAFLGSFSARAFAQQELEGAPPPPVPAGTHAWDFSTRTLAGQNLTMRSLRGHVTVVDFWATWCGPCRMSIPGLEQIYKDYRAKGVHVVGISMDTDTVAQVAPFVHAEHMTYTVAAYPKGNALAAIHYNAAGLPSIYIIDKKGVVRWSFSGFYPGIDHDMRIEINRLLAEKA